MLEQGLGHALNRITLFALIFSIGILVDDAIVVVENVERQLEQGLSPIDAAVAAMREVTGPIIATTAVLLAVFVPVAFLPGVTGRLYNQFALTIAFSTILSAINSLTLSPALAAILLKPHHGAAKPDRLTRIIDGVFGGFFRRFNRFFDRASNSYVGGVRRAVRGSAIVLLLYVGFLGLTWLGFHKVPAGFVPAQDKYYLVGIAQLPTGASLDRTEAVVKEMTKIGLGVGIVAPWVARKEIADGRLVAVPMGELAVKRNWSVFTRVKRSFTLVEETFVGMCSMVGKDLARAVPL